MCVCVDGERGSESEKSKLLSHVQLYSPWDSPGQNTGVGSHSLLQEIFPTQGWNPGLPCCKWILLPTESPGKHKNIGVGCLSLLQKIFPTQESNQGLLHCRWILYQLSFQGSLREGEGEYMLKSVSTSNSKELIQKTLNI